MGAEDKDYYNFYLLQCNVRNFKNITSQDVSRQKSQGFVLHVYVHDAGDFCYT